MVILSLRSELDVVCLVAPEHESDGGEEGDHSAKGDVAPRSRRQGGTVQQGVQTVQEVAHLRKGVKVGGGGNGGRMERTGVIWWSLRWMDDMIVDD